jgi:DNA-binding transcriptional LysR family regulator
MIEMNQITCFITIVEENSFSRAAERLGIAQSAVSQKLRRLEDQLGIHLIDRTSRKLQLSQHGQEFMPYAKQMIEAAENAHRAADRIAESSQNTLRLGGYAFHADMRVDLVQNFLERGPGCRVEVEYGTREQLLSLLSRDKIDAFLCLAGPEGPTPEFDGIFYRRQIAYLALPEGHSLADRSAISISDFDGLDLVISPGRQDSPVLEQLRIEIESYGARLTSAPEADRRSIALYARMHRLPSFRWLAEGTAPYREESSTVVPVTGNALFVDNYIYSQFGPQRPLIERFRQFVKDTAEPLR